jgi:hypothetical protein
MSKSSQSCSSDRQTYSEDICLDCVASLACIAGIARVFRRIGVSYIHACTPEQLKGHVGVKIGAYLARFHNKEQMVCPRLREEAQGFGAAVADGFMERVLGWKDDH